MTEPTIDAPGRAPASLRCSGLVPLAAALDLTAALAALGGEPVKRLSMHQVPPAVLAARAT